MLRFMLLAAFIVAVPVLAPVYAPALIALSLAAVSGMVTLHKHAKVFYDFDVRDLLGFRLDAIFYVLISFSTMLCVIDLAVQSYSLIAAHGSPQLPLLSQHAIALGLVHSGFGLLSMGLHLVVSRMLSNDAFCYLCRRPI